MTCRGPLTSPSPDTESGPAEANWWLLGGGIALLALGLTLLVAGRVERQRWVGIDLLLLGALALGAGLGDLPGRWRALDDAGRQRLATWLAGGLLVVLWAPYILLEQSVDAGGARYWFLGDDAMISMRYARNFAHGDGLVWNPGERVEGFTNPAWTLVMAAVHLTRLPDRFTSLPMLLINLALGVATLPLVARLVRLLGGGAFAVAGALSAVALNQNVGYWATQGFETPLLTLLAMVGVCRILQERGGSPRLSTYLLIGAIGVVRSDGVVLAGLLWAGGVVLCGERRRALLYAGAGLLLPAGAELLRLWYYGEPLPNTAYLKTAKWDGREVAGSRYVARFALRYTVPLIAAVAGAVAARDRRAGLLLGGMALYAVAVALAGGDAFAYNRFFVPALPALLALAFVGVERLAREPSLRAGATALVVLSTPLMLPDWGRVFVAPNRNDAGSVQIGLLIKANTSPGARVADSAAGSVPYFSRRYAIDLLGKTDTHVARLRADPRSGRPGHNKFEYAYSLGELRPDVVVSAVRVPPARPGADQGPGLAAEGDNAFVGALFEDPTFRAHFLPNRVPLDTSRTIFIADWSPEMAGKDQWQPFDAAR